MSAARPAACVLPRLFVVQFFSWSGMFCLWIYAVPVIAGRVFRAVPGSPAYQSALVAVALCYSLYAVLGTTLAFAIPRGVARLGAGTVHGLALLAGGAGIALLAFVHTPGLLAVPFVLIGCAWSSLSQVPYGVAGAAAPEGRGAHVMRLFGFSTVAPQLVTTLALALFAARWIGGEEQRVLEAGGALMAVAGLLALAWRRHFTMAAEDW